MLAVFESSNTSATSTTPTGWTVKSGPNVSDDGGGNSMAGWLYSKVAGSGDHGTGVNFSASAGSSGVVQLYVAQNPAATPIDVFGVQIISGAINNDTTTITAPAATPTSTDTAGLAVFFFGGGAISSSVATITPQAGLTQRGTTANGTNNYVQCAVAELALTSNAAVPAKTATSDQTMVGQGYIVILTGTSGGGGTTAY
jgi:hypothetical protein